MMETGLAHYTDAEAEIRFGLNYSKLRTAQRFGLVSAKSGLLDKRYVRVWSPCGLAWVIVAELASQHLAISFQATCQVLAHSTKRSPEFVERLERRIMGDKDELEFPGLALTDRSSVHLVYASQQISLGRIAQGVDKRAHFETSEDLPYEPIEKVKSRSLVWTIHLVDTFVDLLKK